MRQSVIKTINHYYRTPYGFLVELTAVFFLPLFLLTYVDTFYQTHRFFLLFGLIYVVGIIKWQNIRWKDLGITTFNLKESLRAVMPFTIVCLIVFGIVAYIAPEPFFIPEARIINRNGLLLSIFIYSLFMAPIQEFLFRAIFVERMKQFTSNFTMILIASTLIFAIAHAFFSNIYFVLGTLIPGFLWSYLYLKKHNLIAVTISHVIVGLAVFLPSLVLLSDEITLTKSSSITVSHLIEAGSNELEAIQFSYDELPTITW